VEWLAGELQRVYENLHGEGSAHPEGGAEITAFVVRARGLIDRPVLAAPTARVAPRPASREVYWHELGGYTPTPVVKLEAGAAPAGRLDGPLLLELPDTVIVLRPGQSGQFADNGSLVIDV
jgi:N-methylhydantoinase A